MASYYVQIDGTTTGPIDESELKKLANDGAIARGAQVSPDGKSGWVAISELAALLPENAQAEGAGRFHLNTLAATARFGGAVAKALPSGFLTRRRRIAVTGLASTGKTVFLTTLLNHLENHSPDTFKLDERKSVTAKQFKEIESTDDNEKFNYEIFKQSMRSGRWPKKTFDVSAYACSFTTDNRWGDHQIEFLDWPGERVADVVMYKRDYASWSDYVLNHWDVSRDDYHRHVKPYLAASEQSSLSEESILNEYRIALARLISDYNPLISPSCFLVGRDGNRLRGSSIDELAANGQVGLNRESQFAPLPKASRQRQPGLTRIFADRYEDYRKQVVCRLFDAVQSCNRLIVLVDIPSILASGFGRLTDNCSMIEELIKGLQGNSSRTKGVIKGLWHAVAPASWMWMGVEKIAFVATKADLVAGDENRDNLKILLQSMLGPITNRIPDIEIKYFVASPVASTECPPDGSFLKGKLMHDEHGARLSPDASEQIYRVSPVPRDWPDYWSSGQFSFPSVYPSIPKAAFKLPKHVGLDDVFRFILD